MNRWREAVFRTLDYALIVIGCCLIVPVSAEDIRSIEPAAQQYQAGRTLYQFYCYQCHGYAGNARTLASTFLDPPPRDFRSADPEQLSQDAMVNAITHGKPGTAMVSFANRLSPSDIRVLVQYVRQAFMQDASLALRYHTAEQGWANHERFTAAFPFATGDMPLDLPQEAMTATLRQGKRLFMSACISCHDHSRAVREGVIWQALTERRPAPLDATPAMDAWSGASATALHDNAPQLKELSVAALRGERLFQQNCAFCHAADGSGQNWIGQFLRPHPRNLTGTRVATLSDTQLRQTILEGLPGTSMPAWKHVMHAHQISDLIAYIKRAFSRNRLPDRGPALAPSADARRTLKWQPVKVRDQTP